MDDKIRRFFETIISTRKTAFTVFTNIQLETRRGLNLEATLNTINSLGLDLKKGSEIANSENYTSTLANYINTYNY